jgi:hypothetical protein
MKERLSRYFDVARLSSNDMIQSAALNTNTKGKALSVQLLANSDPSNNDRSHLPCDAAYFIIL